MKLGILSDTHNNRENTLAALDIFRAEDVGYLLHCGDVTTGDIIRLFEGWQMVFVFGNMDRDPQGLIDAARETGLTPPQQTFTLTLDGIPIAVTHGHQDEALQNLIESQQYRYVFHGHTHLRRDEQIGTTRVINPGALGGVQRQSRSVAVVDLRTGDMQFIELEV